MHGLEGLLRAVGYAGIWAIVFAESGLLVGFFLPGDSLLFTAGFLASQGFFNIVALCLVTFTAAVIGDNVGYQFGKKAGPRVFKKEDSLIFNKEHIKKSQAFYEKHGGKTIIIARFIPVVRTFAPVIAGVGEMKYRSFLIYNVIGALIWAVGVTLLGYFLGNAIPDIDKYIIPVAIFIIAISIAPGLWHLFKDQEKRAKYLEHARKAGHKLRRKGSKK